MLQSLSHAQKIIIKDVYTVFEIGQWQAGTRLNYHYIATTFPRFAELLANMQDDDFNPEEYGTTIYSGKGAPSDELVEYMQEHFGLTNTN